MKQLFAGLLTGVVLGLGNAFSTIRPMQGRMISHALHAAIEDSPGYLLQLAQTAPMDNTTLGKISNDLTSLELFLNRTQKAIDSTDVNDQPSLYGDLRELRGNIKWALVTLKPGESAGKSKLATLRVADLNFEVEEQPLLHDFDLTRFRDRVLGLFQWHSKEKQRFMAPYFPLVQSSGTGKTKLMWELRQYINMINPTEMYCKTIACGAAETPSAGESFIYSEYLQVELGQGDKVRSNICQKLDNMVSDIAANKIVLLFDETQHLLSLNGFCFRCIRWWLRLKREKEIVAVFTGTTSLLTNFYAEPPDSTSSRDANLKNYHESGSSLYEPFYMLFTIGIFASNCRVHGGSGSEYERAIPYGRPLFALMQQKNELDKNLFGIAARLRLGYLDEMPALSICMSVLGTRLQMGQTTIGLASNLVANGYALLSYYARTDDERGDLVRICFPTDPVCARLAMCMMDPDWTMSGDDKYAIYGNEKRFWTKMMSEIFSTGLCLPHQGDLGELAAALYLLFCGDVVRKSIDDKYKTFSVPLCEFVERVVDPRLDHNCTQQSAITEVDEDAYYYTEARVSFIQVVRNYIKFSTKDLGNQDFLAQLYRSGCAQYMYAGYEGFDLIASVKLSNAVEEKYVPLLVSVSTKKEFSAESLKNETASLKRIVESINASGGMGIRLVFDRDDTSGRDGRSERNRTKKYLKEGYEDVLLSTKDVSCLLRQEVVSKALIIPENDPFGITEILLRGTSFGPVLSNVFSSHDSLYSHSMEQVNSSSILLTSSTKEVISIVDAVRLALLTSRLEGGTQGQP